MTSKVFLPDAPAAQTTTTSMPCRDTDALLLHDDSNEYATAYQRHFNGGLGCNRPNAFFRNAAAFTRFRRFRKGLFNLLLMRLRSHPLLMMMKNTLPTRVLVRISIVLLSFTLLFSLFVMYNYALHPTGTVTLLRRRTTANTVTLSLESQPAVPEKLSARQRLSDEYQRLLQSEVNAKAEPVVSKTGADSETSVLSAPLLIRPLRRKKNVSNESRFGNLFHRELRIDHYHPDRNATFSNLPLILFWTTYFNEEHPVSQQGQQAFAKCEKKCHASSNHSHFLEADAVIFHGQNWPTAYNDLANVANDFRGRKPEQLFMFHSLESPYNSIFQQLPLNFFNATFTYRLDSDFVATYEGSYAHPPVLPSFDFAANKTKLAVSIVSHCTSDRQALIDELSYHMTVDEFGKCGEHVQTLPDCPWTGGGGSNDCSGKTISQYKFYLSFENSICEDYLTEKVFKPLYFGSLPVIFARANYSRFLPPNSFIDVMSRFATVAELAQYLTYLDQNATAYNEYFRWRSMPNAWPAEVEQRLHSDVFCEICKTLHNNREVSAAEKANTVNSKGNKRFNKTYADIYNWFYSSCTQADDIPIVNDARHLMKVRMDNETSQKMSSASSTLGGLLGAF